MMEQLDRQQQHDRDRRPGAAPRRRPAASDAPPWPGRCTAWRSRSGPGSGRSRSGRRRSRRSPEPWTARRRRRSPTGCSGARPSGSVCQTEAPSVREASSSSSPISSSTGTTSRIVNGMQMKIVTSTIDGSAKLIWMPRASKNGASQPPGANSTKQARPTVTGDSANGRSTSAFRNERPWKRCRTSTHATITPKNVVTTHGDHRDLRRSAGARAARRGLQGVGRRCARPASARSTTIPISGSTSSSPT